jgi:hypothetical protein
MRSATGFLMTHNKDHILYGSKQLTRLCSMLLLGLPLLWTTPVLSQISAFEDPVGTGGSSNTELIPRRDEFDGGEVGQSQTAQVVTLFRNATSEPLTVSRIQLVPSSNVAAVLGSDQCSIEPIKPGVECAVTVSLTGQGTGKYRVGMLVTHTGKTRLTNAAIVGTVGASGAGRGGLQSEIEAFPADLDFGQVTSSSPMVRALALRNSTGVAINIENIMLAASPTSGFEVSAPKCKELKPAQACVATVTWTPTTSGAVEGVIVMRHDGPSGAMRVGLKGVYNPRRVETASRFASAVPGEGLLVADLDKIDFGTEVDGAASISVSLVNQGDKELALTTVRLAGSDNGLSLSNNDCRAGKKLQMGEACILTVNWQPRRIGPVIDDIQILHTGARRALVLPVRGTAEQPVTSSTASTISYNDRIPDMPKIEGGKIDEAVLKSNETATTHTNISVAPQSRNAALTADNVMPSLDGFRISSLGRTHAVVAGPTGRVIVKEGEPQVIAGVRWIPHVVSEGVELTSGKKTVLLVFDRSLTVMQSTGMSSGMQGVFGSEVNTISNVNTMSGTAVTSTPIMGTTGNSTTSGSRMNSGRN